MVTHSLQGKTGLSAITWKLLSEWEIKLWKVHVQKLFLLKRAGHSVKAQLLFEGKCSPFQVWIALFHVLLRSVARSLPSSIQTAAIWWKQKQLQGGFWYDTLFDTDFSQWQSAAGQRIDIFPSKPRLTGGCWQVSKRVWLRPNGCTVLWNFHICSSVPPQVMSWFCVELIQEFVSLWMNY